MSSDGNNTTGNAGPPPMKAFDPGWNDPPTLEYSPSSKTTSGHSRLNLNKRVGIPLQTSNYDKKVESCPAGIPQLAQIPKDLSQPKVAVVPSSTTETDPDEFDKSKEAGYTFKVFKDAAQNLEENRLSEILKRISILEDMWKENKFSDLLCKRINLLAKAMDLKNITEANEIHRSIIIDYGNLSTKWGPALRQIILSIPVEAE